MIHNSSEIDKKAKISENVKIGPFCYVGPHVELADNVELVSNVHIEGNTYVGSNTKIFPFASIGTQPQDLKFKGEKTILEIGTRVPDHGALKPWFIKVIQGKTRKYLDLEIILKEFKKQNKK